MHKILAMGGSYSYGVSLTLLQGRGSEHFLSLTERGVLGASRPPAFMNAGHGSFNKLSTMNPFFISKLGHPLHRDKQLREPQAHSRSSAKAGFLLPSPSPWPSGRGSGA